MVEVVGEGEVVWDGEDAILDEVTGQEGCHED